MERKSAAIALSLAFSMVPTAQAGDSDLAQGEALYTSQCKYCHGNVSHQTGAPAPSGSSVRLAMHQAPGSTARDFPVRLMADPVAVPLDAHGAAAGEPVAFAPPFGPHLRGIVGRPAGSVEGFGYSNTLLKTLKGMEWTEAALDVWITSPQAWVPGVYMFYKQPDAEIRRKIILYLKANP
jgi:cytochrome c2